jgi:hypothetical protein
MENAFGIVADADGNLSKYLNKSEFKALKAWKNLANIAAHVLQAEIEMIIESFHKAFPDPLQEGTK